MLSKNSFDNLGSYTARDRFAYPPSTNSILLQGGDEWWNVCEVNDRVAIYICFGLEYTGLQGGDEWWNICEVNISVLIDISL